MIKIYVNFYHNVTYSRLAKLEKLTYNWPQMQSSIKVFHEQNLIFQILLTPIIIILVDNNIYWLNRQIIIFKLSNSSLSQSQARAVTYVERNVLYTASKQTRFSGSKHRSDFISEQKSAHTNRFSICGNVYDRLDYEIHATDRLKLCVIYRYGNITYKARW